MIPVLYLYCTTLTVPYQGLIISLSILFAAGLAVYENPQVRQWVDRSRRKVAIALYSLGDEIQPRRPSWNDNDASTREDESPEAMERRRRARQEILEKGRLMEERRRAEQDKPARGRSFDDLVDEEGRLKNEKTAIAETTATEVNSAEESLRKRHTETKGAAMGIVAANPFADETLVDLRSSVSSSPAEDRPQHSRESTATLPIFSPNTLEDSTSQDKRPAPLLNTEEASNHPSEQLLDLTPTTSRSSVHDDVSDLVDEPTQPPNYWSVNEWAENTSASFYTPPQSEGRGRTMGTLNTDGNELVQSASRNGDEQASESDLDIVSSISEGMSTPGSWTDVGSVVSEYD